MKSLQQRWIARCKIGNGNDLLVSTGGNDRLVGNDGDGQDIVTGADSFQFSDGIRTAAAEVTRHVFVQPIVVSNDDGSNTATFFGDAAEEFDIVRQIDEIYLQAGIDVEWLTTRTTNSTFFNFGSDLGTRPQSDLNAVVAQRDNIGVGNSDPLVLDLYFVNRVPGFQVLTANSANASHSLMEAESPCIPVRTFSDLRTGEAWLPESRPMRLPTTLDCRTSMTIQIFWTTEPSSTTVRSR